MHPNRQKSVGFTLIEMMVTIAIAALLGLMVVPNLVSMVDSGRTSVLVNKFPQDVAWARNQAVTTQQPVTITLGASITGGNTQTLTFDSQGFINTAPTIVVKASQGQTWTLQVLASGSVILNANTAS
jgi:prepilin-type N-terminal cleavage/methylation domain-containing protein